VRWVGEGSHISLVNWVARCVPSPTKRVARSMCSGADEDTDDRVGAAMIYQVDQSVDELVLKSVPRLQEFRCLLEERTRSQLDHRGGECVAVAKVPVDGWTRHTRFPRDVVHRCLCYAEALESVLGGLEDLQPRLIDVAAEDVSGSSPGLYAPRFLSVGRRTFYVNVQNTVS
jgi:hypothetical protein